jgi:hypothetical protein
MAYFQNPTTLLLNHNHMISIMGERVRMFVQRELEMQMEAQRHFQMQMEAQRHFEMQMEAQRHFEMQMEAQRHFEIQMEAQRHFEIQMEAQRHFQMCKRDENKIGHPIPFDMHVPDIFGSIRNNIC